MPPSDSSSQSRSVVDDPLTPFFLHHSDNPGISLVSQPLTGENYASWSRAMRIALSVKNKLGFIDGSIPQPAEMDLPLHAAWFRSNNVVISWILNSVSKEISASILFSDIAAEIWKDLRERFQQSNGPRIFELRRALFNLTQDQNSVAVYFTKLKTLWDELSNFRPACTCEKCSCGGVQSLASFHHQEHIMMFLLGLNDSFAHITGQLLLMDPLPPVNKIFSLVSQEERQRTISLTPATDSLMAFAVKSQPSKLPSYGQDQQSKFKYKRRDRPYCTKCLLRIRLDHMRLDWESLNYDLSVVIFGSRCGKGPPPPPPPPPGDAAARVLEGIARLMEQAQQASDINLRAVQMAQPKGVQGYH
ncbi:uncharacterized protein LOC142520206 [Primulina tabacum]|uniref:uncharacterized protein LOC142520206 n=1 Tax=Primulina tabacum TaxID=48773 RepID=UPI003F5A14DA